MQKIATVYMLVNGAQTPFPLEEYYKMKATDKYIRKIRFVRIDDCLYEAPTDSIREPFQEGHGIVSADHHETW